MIEPITPEVARGRLGIVSDHRDAEIQQLISSAREHVEDLSGVTLVKREVREYVAFLIDPVYVSARPVKSLTSIDYVDGDGLPQSILDARLVQVGRSAALRPVLDGAWPGDYSEVVAVMQVGYEGTEEDPYPPKLIQAILVLVAHWFDDPKGEQEIPDTVSDLCYQARSWQM